MTHQRWLLRHLFTCNQSCIKGECSRKKRANFLSFMKKCREAPKKNDSLLGLEPSSAWPPEKPPQQEHSTPFWILILSSYLRHKTTAQPTPTAIRRYYLLTWQQHPTSAWEQPLRDFNLPSWQQPPTCAPNTPNLWLVLTTTMSKAGKMTVAKVIARETTSLATTKNQVNKMLGE